MPLETNLSAAPYNDDFNEDKKFHRVLFKPEIAVQVRELNTLQSILQNQIERFGNNVFKRGTIIDGANFSFYDSYPYVKINDLQLDGKIAIPENYLGYLVKNESGLIGRIINYADGFETTNPNLKTIYVKYINSGNSYDETEFSAGQILTVYDANNVISRINVVTPGTGYTNTDVAVTTPVLLANVNSGQFNVGDTFINDVTGAEGVITAVSINTDTSPNIVLGGSVTTVAASANVNGTGTTFLSNFSNGDFITVFANNTSYVSKKINVVSNNTFMNLTSNVGIAVTGAQYANTVDKTVYISYKPTNADLNIEDASANTWTFVAGSSIRGASNTDIAQVKTVYGVNAAGVIKTDSSGRIVDVSIANKGSGYSIIPVVSIKTTTGSGANLAAQNYYSQVTASSLAGSVGSGYAFGISEGIVYQKGFFIKVDPQTIIVSKYNNIPDNVTVGFYTSEEIINADMDNSLFDNVNGENNLAPGADRLKLSANLVVKDLTVDSDDAEFFNLVEWSEGFPFKQNNRTAYNVIADDIATRTWEVDGNFVVDQFLVTSTDTSNTSMTANTFNVVVDPGTAYVEGKRIQTVANFSIKNEKGISTSSSNNSKVSINYENYIRVNNVGGFFEFDRANTIDLYDTAKGYLESSALVAAGATGPVGNKIGTARLRNFTFEQGTVGTSSGIHRAYIFDIKMDAGKNFSDVRSIHYDGAVDGIADVVLDKSPAGADVAAVRNGTNDSLLFTTKYASPLKANNVVYQYRTTDTQVIANTGVITISLTSSPGNKFPYTGTLSDSQKSEIYVAPDSNLIAYSPYTGTVNISSTSTEVTGTGTNFVGQIKPGQFISVNTAIRRVISVTNSQHLVVDANVGVTSTGEEMFQAWPIGAPINLAYNSSVTASTSGANDDILTISLGRTLDSVTSANVSVAYNVESTKNATPKTANRKVFVKLALANNAGGVAGPWSLGRPDVFRLRNVYRGTATVNVNSSNITSEFFVDHNQNMSYYNLSTLNKVNKSSLFLTEDDYLLVEFDCFTTTPGFYTINSYVSGDKTNRYIEDSKSLDDLTTTVNTLEIPEVFNNSGIQYDLISCVDFRPYADSTAALTTDPAAATINPSNTVSFASADRFFPVPGSIFNTDIEYFEGRTDSVVLDIEGNIRVMKGTVGANSAPKIPSQAMRLNNVKIPAYPSLPTMLSKKTKDILATGVYSGQFSGERVPAHTISTTFTAVDMMLSQPKNKTQSDIGAIERRVTNLEYYQMLTFAQSQIKDKVIPSSLSPNIDRFKYGFFIDNYDDLKNSEDSSPEYKATIDEGVLTAARIKFNTVHTGAGLTAAPYTSVKIVSQNLATLDPVPEPEPPPPVPPVVTPPTPPTPPYVPPVVDYIGNMVIQPPTFKTQQYVPQAAPSSGSVGKIICTAMNEAYGFGSFRNAIWIDHSRTMAKEYEVGYHAIFLPLVDFMYRSKHKNGKLAKNLRTVFERIARKRTADLWKSKRGKMDLEGRVYRTILEPICFAVGFIKNKMEGK